MKDYLKLWGLIVAVFVGCFMLLCLLMSGVCSEYSTQTGKETKASYGTCYIKHNNEWYSWEEYKLRNITAGAK